MTMHTSRDTISQCGVFPNLARGLTEAGHDVTRIFEALSAALVPDVCDRCSIDLSSTATVTRAPRHIVLALTRGGSVTLSREDTSPELEGAAPATIEGCIAFASLEAGAALELEHEHERTAQFQRDMLGIVG